MLRKIGSGGQTDVLNQDTLTLHRQCVTKARAALILCLKRIVVLQTTWMELAPS